MNTGLLRPDVATVPTVYGIETNIKKWLERHQDFSDLLDMYFLEIAKGQYGEEIKFDEKFLKDILRENEIELKSFSAKQLLEYYGIK